MSKKLKKGKVRPVRKKHNSGVSPQAKWGGIAIMVIMLFSVLGFAMMSGGGGNVSSNELPDELNLQEFNNNGQVFWGAIKGGEQFVFLSIDGYDDRYDLATLANEIKSKDFLNVNIDPNFISDDSVYTLEKALTGLKINYVLNYDSIECDDSSLVLTLSKFINGSCIVFNPEQGEEARDAEILVYHLIK